MIVVITGAKVGRGASSRVMWVTTACVGVELNVFIYKFLYIGDVEKWGLAAIT